MPRITEEEKTVYAPDHLEKIGSVVLASSISPKDPDTISTTFGFNLPLENIDDFILQLLAMKKICKEKEIDSVNIRVWFKKYKTKKGFPIRIRS